MEFAWQVLYSELNRRIGIFRGIDVIRTVQRIDVERDPVMRRQFERRRLDGSVRAAPGMDAPGGATVIDTGSEGPLATYHKAARQARQIMVDNFGEVTDVLNRKGPNTKTRCSAVGFGLHRAVRRAAVALCCQRTMRLQNREKVVRFAIPRRWREFPRVRRNVDWHHARPARWRCSAGSTRKSASPFWRAFST